MFRQKWSLWLVSLLTAGVAGCSVDLNAAASNAIQSMFNSIFAVFTANLINSLVPVG